MEGVTSWSQFSGGLPGFHPESPVAQPVPQSGAHWGGWFPREAWEGVVCPRSQNPSQVVNPAI